MCNNERNMNLFKSKTQEVKWEWDREKMRSREDGYAFVKITDAIVAVNKKVNLIGAVVDFGQPKLSKGTDWFCSVSIIDESHTKPGLKVHIFAENAHKLPQVESSGDIIQLHHVTMKQYGPSLYAVFNKRVSSFALHRGTNGEGFHPYQASSTFSLTKHGKNSILHLRKWLHEINKDRKDFMLLREIKEGKNNSFICKVLHICNVSEDEQMAFIWDGTDTPPISIQLKFENEVDVSFPLQLEPLPLSRDVVGTFPTIGTILRVTIDVENEKYASRLHIGKWMKFINLACEIKSGLWHGKLMKSTKLGCLPEDNDIVQDLQRMYNGRASSRFERMSFWTFPWPSRITEVENGGAPIVTLMDVLTSSKVTAQFHCAVRIVAIYPSHAENFRCPCTKAYRVTLTLEDPTARIRAFVYDEDGETFFNGSESVDELIRKRNRLLGMTDDEEVRKSPFVQCRLRSYYCNKSDVWGSRHYRVIRTKVVDD